MKNIIVYLIVLCAFTPSVRGQLILPEALREPVENAMEKDKPLANKTIALEQADLERRSILSKYIPRLEASANYTYFDNRLKLDMPSVELPIIDADLFEDNTKFHNHGNLFHAELMAKTVLFSGLQIKHGAQAMKEKAKGDKLMMESDKDSLVIDVVSSFDKLKYLKISQELINDSDKRLKKEEKRVKKAIKNGLAVPFDREKIKLKRLELESKQTELEDSRDLLLKKLRYLTGMSQNEIQNTAYELKPLMVGDELSIDSKQEIEALKSYKKAGKQVLKKKKGAFCPNWGLLPA